MNEKLYKIAEIHRERSKLLNEARKKPASMYRWREIGAAIKHGKAEEDILWKLYLEERKEEIYP